MYGKNAIIGRGVTHSILFGATSGVLFWGGLFLYRGIYLTCFDTETVPLESRGRYEEKQLLFQEKLSNDIGRSIIASLVKEYNPVHLRLPFTDMNLDKHNL